MTKQAKIIIGAVGGLVLIGGFIFVAAIAVIGLSVAAAQANDSTENKSAATTRDKNGITKQRKNSVDDAGEKDENPRRSNKDSDDETSEAASLNGDLAPELVGKWMWSEGRRQVDSTGKTQYGGGSWHTYEFAADGSVEYTMKKDLLTIMQCQINETKTGRGTAASDGETLTIQFGEMRDTGTSSCGGDGNFDKTIPAETVELKYELKTEYGETQLCITGENGERCYQKEKE